VQGKGSVVPAQLDGNLQQDTQQFNNHACVSLFADHKKELPPWVTFLNVDGDLNTSMIVQQTVVAGLGFPKR
jgi:hypothetical protein